MPAFLIVHCASPDGRLDAFRHPPTLEIGGLRAPLDWGDVTLHVPAGDLRVAVFATRPSGQVDGATLTVRAPAGTGTRLTFVPPLQPGASSTLRIEGQWPADSTMHYYAARDARVLTQAPTPSVTAGDVGSTRGGAAASVSAAAPASIPPAADVRVVGQAAPPPVAPTPPVGPTPGSTGAVPPRPTAFGHEQGARVDPVQSPSAPNAAQRGPAPQHPQAPGQHPQMPTQQQPQPLAQQPQMQHPQSQQQPGHPGAAQVGPAPAGPALAGPALAGPARPPSFGQRPPRTERDVYGREHVADDRQAAPIPTPAQFHQLEREAAEAQRRVYEAWQAQQRQRDQPSQPAHSPHDGAPRPIGLQAGTGQAQPAWYPDPFRRADQRWFDGRQWTPSVMRGGVRGTDQPG